jgi:pimeloyl-ACP methyl ester carboxylesterase
MDMPSIPIVFDNKQGLKLFGILHIPKERASGDTAIVILSPGIKSRVAPHRLYVKMAREFVAAGFPVFRFDFYGLGDSEGEVDVEQTADLYGSIQVGRYVEDTIAALDWLEAEHGLRKFILSGLCGGAITGLLAGAQDRRVDSIIGLGIPVILDSNKFRGMASQFLTSKELDEWRLGYLKNLLNVQSWIRLLTFKSDYRALFRSFGNPVRKLFGKSQGEKPQAPAPLADNFNDLFPGAFEAFVATPRKILLLFGESDRLLFEFEEKFLGRHGPRFEQYRGLYDVQLVSGARHIFELPEQLDEMLGKASAWLEKHYPRRAEI